MSNLFIIFVFIISSYGILSVAAQPDALLVSRNDSLGFDILQLSDVTNILQSCTLPPNENVTIYVVGVTQVNDGLLAIGAQIMPGIHDLFIVDPQTCNVISSCTAVNGFARFGITYDANTNITYIVNLNRDIVEINLDTCAQSAPICTVTSAAGLHFLDGTMYYNQRTPSQIVQIPNFLAGGCMSSTFLAVPGCTVSGLSSISSSTLVASCLQTQFITIDIPTAMSTGVLLSLPILPFGVAAISFQRQSGISGDPHFIGLNSQKFDFHGEADKYYALVSDEKIEINALFVDADLRYKGGKTYLGQVGILLGNDRIFISCDRNNLTHRMELNYAPLNPGDVHRLPFGVVKVSRSNKTRLVVLTDNYRLSVRFSSSRHSTCHLNMRTKYTSPASHGMVVETQPHGVLGQTAGKPVLVIDNPGMNGEGIIEGIWTDYIVTDIFSTEFKYSQFKWSGTPKHHVIDGGIL
mmetsp:Transcript_20792/g.23129  ORF Transcript_20792/g.23129 Transcript_20792/m.23129 type:complete len:465 (-) Transcript_20792:92-1486(-)